MRFFLFFCFTTFLPFFSSANAEEQALNTEDIFSTNTYDLDSANVNLSNPGVSNYNTLKSYYAKGVLPAEADITGWWSGRCYGKESQNAPSGMLLLALSVTVPPASNDGGPLFPTPNQPTKIFNVALANHSGNQFHDTPDRYDNLTSGDKTHVQNFIDSDDFKTLKTTTTEGSLISKNEPTNLKYLVRKYQNYFVAQAVILRNHDKFKAGEVYASCYFFKKVN